MLRVIFRKKKMPFRKKKNKSLKTSEVIMSLKFVSKIGLKLAVNFRFFHARPAYPWTASMTRHYIVIPSILLYYEYWY